MKHAVSKERQSTADAREAAPPALRRAGRIALALLLLGAAYLIAVRREAILTDLATLAAWCF